MSGKITPAIRWVDQGEAAQVTLPNPWPSLEARGFYPDLTSRVRAHVAYAQKHNVSGVERTPCETHGYGHNAHEVVRIIGEGFATPFDRRPFEPEEGDSYFGLKRSALNALDELAQFYSDRISAVVWQALAYLACREEPEEERSILREAHTGKLPMHYLLLDSCLHAVGLVYPFLMHVNSVMFAHTGRVLIHNCDCGCSLVNLEEARGRIEYTLPQDRIEKATQSVLTHLLAETIKLMECFLPFAYGLTPEAVDIRKLLENKPAG